MLATSHSVYMYGAIYQLDYELEISMKWWLMRAKPESTITSQKSKASNLIVLVESETKHKIFSKNIE